MRVLFWNVSTQRDVPEPFNGPNEGMTMVFAAIQFKEGETAHQTVANLMQTAHVKELPFAQLELLGVLQLGRHKFVRFRTDCKELPEILGQLLLDGRGVVYQEGGSYKVQFPTGQKGPVSAMMMLAIGDPSVKRQYRGPAIQFWDRQFLPS
jgi:hypothetical protein